MNRTLLTLLIQFSIGLFGIHDLMGYQKADSTQFSYYLTKAKNYDDSSISHFKLSEKYATSEQAQTELAYEWARYYFTINELDSSLLKLSKTLAIENTEGLNEEHVILIARSLYLASYMKGAKEEYRQAIAYLTTAKDRLEDREIKITLLHDCYSSIGNYYRNLEEPDQSFYWHQKALSIALAENMPTSQLRSFGNIGLFYLEKNKVDLAKSHFTKILHLIAQDTSIEEQWAKRIITSTHNNLGVLLMRKSDLDSAQYHFTKSTKVAESVRPADIAVKRYLALGFNNLAQFYLNSKKYDFDSAVHYAKRSIEMVEDAYGENHSLAIKPITALGKAHLMSKDYENALLHYQEMLIRSKELNIFLPNAHYQFGDFFRETGDFEKSEQHYDSSLWASSRDNLYGLTFEDFEAVFYALKGKSHILLEDPSTKLENIEKLYGGLEEYLTLYYKSNENRPNVENVTATLENIYLAYSAIPDSKTRANWYDKMWELSEINKSIKLRNQLRNEYSLNYSLPPEILLREKELSDSINSQISNIKPGVFDSTLFELERKYEQFIEQVEKEYPKYYNLKTSYTNTTLQDLQKGLNSKELVLSFFEGAENIYAMKIYSDSIQSYRIEKEALDSLIDVNNRLLLEGKDPHQSSIAIQKLLQLKVDDLQKLNVIKLIPDGLVWKLNFAALTFELEEKREYLGNVKPLVYQYFGSQVYTPQKSAGKEVLALSYSELQSNPVETSYYALRDLDGTIPGTSKEVTAISELLEGDYYYADQANETLFKREAQDYKILHLSVHGQEDATYPENSFLQFNSKDSLNDGRLYAYELYNMNLNADLAVLSACNSGDGKIETGEGMMSMGRSFAYAGVNSLLASRWEVPDISAPYIMKYFYEGLKEGMHKSEALRYAQNKFLDIHADNVTRSPFYWAGFYIIGNDDPIYSSSRYYLISGVSILLILGMFVLRRARLVKK